MLLHPLHHGHDGHIQGRDDFRGGLDSQRREPHRPPWLHVRPALHHLRTAQPPGQPLQGVPHAHVRRYIIYIRESEGPPCLLLGLLAALPEVRDVPCAVEHQDAPAGCLEGVGCRQPEDRLHRDGSRCHLAARHGAPLPALAPLAPLQHLRIDRDGHHLQLRVQPIRLRAGPPGKADEAFLRAHRRGRQGDLFRSHHHVGLRRKPRHRSFATARSSLPIPVSSTTRGCSTCRDGWTMSSTWGATR